MVEGKDIVVQLAQKFSLPQWWIELVLIEYTECRHFCREEEIWSIDFNLIEKRDLEEVLKSSKVVVAATSILYHNISKDEWNRRIIESNLGQDIGEIRTDILVDGLANTDCFLVKFNSIDEWDPKLSFNDYCIILDEGRFYQRKIASHDKSEWNSKISNLSDLNRTNKDIDQLRNDYAQKKDITLRSLRSKSEILYKDLERIRNKIRRDLLSYHNSQILEDKNKRISSQLIPERKIESNTSEISHYGRPLIISMESAFQYFSDVESFPNYYPNICKKIDVILKSNDSNVTKEFWNVSINDKIDHVVLKVRYTFAPPNTISYEIIDGYEKAIGIKNTITLNVNSKGMTFVEGNNPLLDVICYPPHSVQMDEYSYKRYTDLIDYFIWMDCIHLEKKPLEQLKEGDVCTKCKIGHLEKSIKKEDFSNAKGTFRIRTEFWFCDSCGQEFKHYRADV
ncbi:MAG: hypothetical protein L0H53_14750 [Candidatus Nitrosocosmicus sp.]|nr:hypothetical protein [Candidatus Nitrosocosmicus sp.]MDN5868813.1 hypothetical protein [Candidatus Nitrosocosmicus sp.]